MSRGPLTALTTRILLALVAGRPRYGYALRVELAKQGDGGAIPQTGSLYLALNRLASEGLIQASACQDGVPADSRCRYWVITEDGRSAVAGEVARLKKLLKIAADRIPEFNGCG